MKVHIIGGGIIGWSTAWYLNEAGFEVSIIEKEQKFEGCSHGNSGIIVPSHFVPLAAPGVITKGIKWMFDAKSPFYIKPG
jgi:D-amino-acid dehydrogenase